jgi:hypothetical protein
VRIFQRCAIVPAIVPNTSKWSIEPSLSGAQCRGYQALDLPVIGGVGLMR